jgi:hypothetical protein
MLFHPAAHIGERDQMSRSPGMFAIGHQKTARDTPTFRCGEG